METFALDLGNKQVKLKSSKGSYILPSRFLNQADAPINLGTADHKDNLHTYAVPFSDDRYIWGPAVNQLHLDDYLTDTIMYGNRYDTLAFRLMANFAMGLLAMDFPDADTKVISVNVVAGMPTEDYRSPEAVEAFLNTLKGQHQVTIDNQVLTVRVRKVDLLPQPIGTLYNELLDKSGYIKDEDLLEEKVGIVDIGGGTILIDSILNFQLSGKNRKQYNTGVNDLYEQISSAIPGDVSLYQLEQVLRSGQTKQQWTYSFSKNNSLDITDPVLKAIKRFTERVIGEVTATLKNLATIDTLIFTGGGAALVDQKLIAKAFPNVVFAENAETANVEGFMKFGLSETIKNKEEK